jgi:hypothetical protein
MQPPTARWILPEVRMCKQNQRLRNIEHRSCFKFVVGILFQTETRKSAKITIAPVVER